LPEEVSEHHHQIVHRLSRRKHVQCDHAGLHHVIIVHVTLPPTLFFAECFLCEHGGGNQVVALQATCPRTGEHGPSGNKDILYLAGCPIYRHLGSYLSARYKILVHQSIEHAPALNSIAGQEQEVYIGQHAGYVFIQDTAYNGVKADMGVCLAGYTTSYMHLVPSEPLTQLL
jgi:hypothetical protein